MITDPSDPRLDCFRDLRSDRDRRHDPSFVCEGAICCRRALENPRFHIETLFTTESQFAALVHLLQPHTQVLLASNQVLQEVVGYKFHRGVLATVQRPMIPPPDFSTLKARSRVVFAEAISNPSNMGSLIRNCRSFGADLLVFTESSAEPFTRHAVRSSMGNVFAMPLARVMTLPASIADYRYRHGAAVFAATLGQRAEPLPQTPRLAHMGVVIGTEATGLLPGTIAAASHEVTIPMAAGADSLNVAAASAVFLYAFTAA